MRLPLARLVHANQSAAPASAALRGLLVDDSVDAAMAMSRVPESDGHYLSVAHEAVTALKLAEQFAPEVALPDPGPPGMDDFQFAHELRKRGATANALRPCAFPRLTIWIPN
ncbi:hypothetical protein [Paraburkholderia sp. DGU8]|uniref:hypothetical protein n=1 Tax=Paraburkholderia sp. DGU8 TaxID=3161997 RepID=UPI003466B7EB